MELLHMLGTRLLVVVPFIAIRALKLLSTSVRRKMASYLACVVKYSKAIFHKTLVLDARLLSLRIDSSVASVPLLWDVLQCAVLLKFLGFDRGGLKILLLHKRMQRSVGLLHQRLHAIS